MAHSQFACPLFLLCSLLMLPSVLMLEVGVPGGIFPLPVTDEEFQQDADLVVEEYNKESKDSNYYKKLSIVTVKGKGAKDKNYFLMVEIGKTVCEKSSGPLTLSEIQDCELLPPDQQEAITCLLLILFVSRHNYKQLLDSSCP